MGDLLENACIVKPKADMFEWAINFLTPTVQRYKFTLPIHIANFIQSPLRNGDSENWELHFMGTHLMGQVHCLLIWSDKWGGAWNKGNIFILNVYFYYFQQSNAIFIAVKIRNQITPFRKLLQNKQKQNKIKQANKHTGRNIEFRLIQALKLQYFL